jgi:hypothetical protein
VGVVVRGRGGVRPGVVDPGDVATGNSTVARPRVAPIDPGPEPRGAARSGPPVAAEDVIGRRLGRVTDPADAPAVELGSPRPPSDPRDP